MRRQSPLVNKISLPMLHVDHTIMSLMQSLYSFLWVLKHRCHFPHSLQIKDVRKLFDNVPVHNCKFLYRCLCSLLMFAPSRSNFHFITDCYMKCFFTLPVVARHSLLSSAEKKNSIDVFIQFQHSRHEPMRYRWTCIVFCVCGLDSPTDDPTITLRSAPEFKVRVDEGSTLDVEGCGSVTDDPPKPRRRRTGN